MTNELKTLSMEQLRDQWRELYSEVQKPSCPREIVLAFDAVTDEMDLRPDRFGGSAIYCMGPDDEPEGAYWDQPPGSEWGA